MFDTTLPDSELRRTARQCLLPGFGTCGQEALHAAHVVVLGAGGLGCPVMQTLAATGVGTITVIDDDTVDLSNIHRQILFGASDVGRPKVEVAAERLRELQPGITVNPLEQRFTAANARSLLAEADLLIDGSDNFVTKFLAADATEVTGTPLVWGTVLRFQGDVGVWWSGPGHRGVGLRDLFLTHPAQASVPDCATAGVLGVTTSVVAGLMATEAIKFISGLNDQGLSVNEARLHQVGRLMRYDALSASLRTYSVGPDPERELVTQLVQPEAGAQHSFDDSLLDLVRGGQAVAVDVRELGERALRDIEVGSLHLPTSQASPESVAALLDGVDAHDVVVYCASGARSAQFVEDYQPLAHARGIRLHSLPGGANAHGQES